jgi:glycosyltransferase 2 family protein
VSGPGDPGQDHRPVDAGTGPGVGSDPMDLTAPAPAIPSPTPATTSDDDAPVEPGQLSVTRRLRQPRTILSIAVPLVIIAIFFWLNGDRLVEVPKLLLQADWRYVAVAFAIFYLGFPLRGYRWKLLLRGTGVEVSTRDSTEIIFLSWLVNCIVPAKLGDVYRGYLLKINSAVSLSRTLGTVFMERVLDVFAIAVLGMAAGFWSFRNGLPPAIQIVFLIGVIVVLVLAVGLLTMRNFGRRILNALPTPHQVLDLYNRFEEGVFGAVPLRWLPRLAILTAFIWLTEGLRLYFVIASFGFDDVSIGLSGAVFVALIGSLLTAVPLSPAGLGIADAGIVFVLTVAYGVPLPEATAIALLDRVISVFSIIVFGSIAHALSDKPRGGGRIEAKPRVVEA